jgi:hypothetical protein
MKSIWPVYLTLVVGMSGCGTYIGLDPEFGRNTQDRNRVAIQWCIVDHLNHSSLEPAMARTVVAAAGKKLRDKGYVIVNLDPPLEIERLTEGADTNAPYSDTVADLVSLHRTAITNPGKDWTDGEPVDHFKTFSFRDFYDVTNALTRRIVWPPAGLDSKAAAKVDGVLFLALDYNLEGDVERSARRKDNKISVPLAVVTVPLVLFTGGMAGAPRIFTDTSSWVECSAILVSPDDGRLLYRQHHFFLHSDARKTDTLRDRIGELFDKLPDGD